MTGILLGLTLFSIITVIGFLTVGAKMLARLPPDYFINEAERRKRHYLDPFPPSVRPVIHVARNVFGLLFVIIGAILLLLPGQGLLTMLAGFILLDFPGKFACERWIVRRRQVKRAIDWMRHRAGQPPLELDPDSGRGEGDD